jgi:hypothetical protein
VNGVFTVEDLSLLKPCFQIAEAADYLHRMLGQPVKPETLAHLWERNGLPLHCHYEGDALSPDDRKSYMGLNGSCFVINAEPTRPVISCICEGIPATDVTLGIIFTGSGKKKKVEPAKPPADFELQQDDLFFLRDDLNDLISKFKKAKIPPLPKPDSINHLNLEPTGKAKGSYLRTIHALSMALIKGTTRMPHSDAQAVFVALANAGITPPITEKTLAAYLKAAKELLE